MASIHWGRKETIIFPPHSAIYTYGAVLFAVILTGLFVYLRFTFGNTPLQRFYTPIYIRSSVAGSVSASRKDRKPTATGYGRGRGRREHAGTGNESAPACALQVRLAGGL
jgi:hypothetical protein